MLSPIPVLRFLPAFLIAVAQVLPVASAGAAEPVLTPHRVAEIRAVTAVALSPDGSQLAYTLSVPRRPGEEEDGEPWAELWVLPAAGGTPRAYVAGKVNVSLVRWLPGGREIAFLAKRGDDKVRSLHVIPLGGGEARRVLAPASDIVDYSLAPEGKRVAFVAREAEDDAVRKLREKGFRAEVYEEDWRPQRVWVAALTEKPAPVALPVEGHVRAVRWSPVDERLLVTIAPTPGVDHGMMQSRLRVIAADTGAIQTRIENPGKLGAFAWSPDARRIAFISGEDTHDPSAGRLMVADAATGAFRQVLAPAWQGDVSDVAWLDAGTIAVLADEGVESYVGRVRAEATGSEIGRAHV